MSFPSPQMRNLVERLIAHESRNDRSSGKDSPAKFPVCEKLRPPVAALVGSTGFSALMTRALALAGPEVPWLRGLRIKADGSLEGLAELEAQNGPEKIAEGRVALLAHLLGLLRGFIGDHLTLQLLREVWPKLSIKEVFSRNGNGDPHERTK